jgi:hypothetical protein
MCPNNLIGSIDAYLVTHPTRRTPNRSWGPAFARRHRQQRRLQGRIAPGLDVVAAAPGNRGRVAVAKSLIDGSDNFPTRSSRISTSVRAIEGVDQTKRERRRQLRRLANLWMDAAL